MNYDPEETWPGFPPLPLNFKFGGGSSSDSCTGWYCCKADDQVVFLEDCADKSSYSCGSSSAGISVACCSNTIPVDIILTISGFSESFVMAWNGIQWATGLVTIPGCGTVNISLLCAGGDLTGWNFGSDPSTQCIVVFNVLNYSRTCVPFQISTTGVFTGGGCSCNFTRTFTATGSNSSSSLLEGPYSDQEDALVVCGSSSSSSSSDSCAGWYCCQENKQVVYFSDCAEKNAYDCAGSSSSSESSSSSSCCVPGISCTDTAGLVQVGQTVTIPGTGLSYGVAYWHVPVVSGNTYHINWDLEAGTYAVGAGTYNSGCTGPTNDGIFSSTGTSISGAHCNTFVPAAGIVCVCVHVSTVALYGFTFTVLSGACP